MSRVIAVWLSVAIGLVGLLAMGPLVFPTLARNFDSERTQGLTWNGAALDTPTATSTAGAITFVVPLTGGAEVPGPGDPDGAGTATLQLNPSTGEICYDLTVSNIEPATMAHIHVGDANTAGPVVQGLNPPTTGMSSGCVTNADLVAAIIANPENYYVNVHNTPFPAGAVRGQLAGAVGEGLDAEVNISVNCATMNTDGTYTVDGSISVLNQSEDGEDIRITEATAAIAPGMADLTMIETFFEGMVIFNGDTLTYMYLITLDPQGNDDAQFDLSFSILFENAQSGVNVASPREDLEEFFLDACDPAEPTATATSTETTDAATATATATATEIASTATNTAVPPTATSTEVPPTATNTAVPPAATNTAVVFGGTDAEVNISVNCATMNSDGTYTVGGVVSVLNQSEDGQDITITDGVAFVVPGAANLSGIEAAFEGQTILNGQTLSVPYSFTLSRGGNDEAQFTLGFSVFFQSVQSGAPGGPREDAEEFYLDAKDSCSITSSAIAASE